ncbi:MAG: hypothetical protein FD162_2212 [Rhodobacteraceae bacterium]|uniref:hypothetical protein n=1 Tax=Cypionkella sp. TaxID=2811411 RepID=UPI00132697E6|nr:hypothetical protein [Cypionkella sp.]KAF0172622.1 MAG: hypothetical protein FD162_2212 [Paracoccaceae bacterium]MDO8325953.1 hypothetical protein [Cypionkella sp.]
MRTLLTAMMGFAILAFLMTGMNPWYLLHQTILARDPGYAEAVFKDRAAFGRALSSIAHADDGCAVAVVQLYETPAVKPSRAAYSPAEPDRFSGWWRNTPLRMRALAKHDLLETCRAHIDAGSRAQLHAAMQAEGTFVILDPQGEVLQIYAPRPQLAAYLRHADPAAQQP